MITTNSREQFHRSLGKLVALAMSSDDLAVKRRDEAQEDFDKRQEEHKAECIKEAIYLASALTDPIFRIADALEKIAAQGDAPTLRSVAEGINSRPLAPDVVLGADFTDHTDAPKGRERL